MGIYASAQVAFSLLGIYDPFVFQRVAFLARGQAFTYEPSYYALYMTLFVMFYNARFQLSNYKKSSLLKLLGVNMLLIVSTSTGILFSYPLFVITMIPFKISWKKLFYFSSMLVSVIASIFFFWRELIQYSLLKFFYWGFGHGSFLARWEGICNCLQTFYDNFWIGVGLGGIGPYLYQHHYAAGNHIETLSEAEMFDPTNTFTEILGSLGIVGFCAFSFLAWRFIQSYKRAVASIAITQDAKILAASFFISVWMGVIVLQLTVAYLGPIFGCTSP